MRGRRVHQHRASLALDHAEIAAERRIAGQRQDFRALPPARGKELRRIGRRFHLGGHRPSHDGGTSAVKISVAILPEVERQPERLRPAIGSTPLRPFDQQQCIRGRVQSQLFDLRTGLDPIKIDMPHRRIERLIGLDDRKARARHLTLVAQRGDQSPRHRRLADAQRPRQRDHVPCSRHSRQAGAERRRFRLIFQNHRDPRGIVRVTVVPLPFFDSSSTVPP